MIEVPARATNALLMPVAPCSVVAQIEKKGTAPYVTHFIFPAAVDEIEIPDLVPKYLEIYI